jgi:hypothetical protein
MSGKSKLLWHWRQVAVKPEKLDQSRLEGRGISTEPGICAASHQGQNMPAVQGRETGRRELLAPVWFMVACGQ